MVSAPPHAGYRIVPLHDYIPSFEQPVCGHLARLPHLQQAHRFELCRAAAADRLISVLSADLAC
jgi:hypothetical protein